MKKNTSNNTKPPCAVYLSTFSKLIAVCCLVLIISCKAKKQLVVNRIAPVNTPAPVNEKRERLNAIRSAQITFTIFSGKARTKLDFSGNSNDVTLNIRIRKDQEIWVSVTAIAGIEVARALITPDSILVMNKLQSVYLRKPFSYIHKYTGNQVNYQTLESLLTGNAIPELLNEQADLKVENGNTVLNGDLQELVYRLVIGPDLKVSQTSLGNAAARQSLQVLNAAFIRVGDYVVPSQIDIASVVKDQKIQVNLHYVKMEFNKPLDFPFSIPARYTPAD